MSRTDKTIVVAAPVPEEKIKSGPERRAWFRYPFTATAEIFDLRSQTRVTGRCADLSSGGCYVDTLSPFAVGTAVRVHIKRDKIQFDATAKVTYAHPSMGMGLIFAEIKSAQQEVLREWVANLNDDQPLDPQVPGIEPEPDLMIATANMRQTLNELINLMIRKNVITDKEGQGLRRQMFR